MPCRCADEVARRARCSLAKGRSFVEDRSTDAEELVEAARSRGGAEVDDSDASRRRCGVVRCKLAMEKNFHSKWSIDTW